MKSNPRLELRVQFSHISITGAIKLNWTF